MAISAQQAMSSRGKASSCRFHRRCRRVLSWCDGRVAGTQGSCESPASRKRRVLTVIFLVWMSLSVTQSACPGAWRLRVTLYGCDAQSRRVFRTSRWVQGRRNSAMWRSSKRRHGALSSLGAPEDLPKAVCTHVISFAGSRMLGRWGRGGDIRQTLDRAGASGIGRRRGPCRRKCVGLWALPFGQSGLADGR